MTTLEAQPISLRVQPATMDERKRSANYDNDDIAPPLKRQAIGINGASKRDSDADGIGRDPELEEFQKEAALRQMNEYKRAKRTIEKEFDDLQKKAAAHDDHIRAIDAWFSQLLDEIKISADQYQQASAFSVFPSSLLSSDAPTFENHLKKRANQITEDVRAIFAKGHEREPSVVELQAEVAKLVAAAKKQANELEKNRLEKEQIEERLETASMRYMVAEKKLDRVKSQTVQRLEKQLLATSTIDPSKPSKDDKVEPQDTVSSQALRDAEIALQAALAESAKQAEQLQELVQGKHALQSQLTETKVKATQQSDDDFAQTELFKQLKKQLEDFVNRVNGLEASNNELRRETKKLQEERAAYRTDVDAELHAATADQQQHLARLEADLARIRTARDELEAEKGMRETTFRSDKNALAQMKEVLAGKDEKIKALESQIERFDQSDSVAIPEGDFLPVDELRSHYAKATKQLDMMKHELEAMGKAYTKLSASVSSKYNNQADMEEKLQRLSAEKAKADQKYFSAMKSKDTFAAEVKTLRAQNAKSSEMIASFKDLESASRQQLINLEKQIAEAREAFTILETKHYAVQSQIADRNSQTDVLKKQVEELKSLVASKDNEHSQTATQLRKAEVSLEKLKATLGEKEKHFELFKAAAIPAGSDSEVTEQLRTMALCNVCRVHFKDRVIMQCGHTFCKDCIDERVANRMRKCPNCNVAFGTNDVRSIVL